MKLSEKLARHWTHWPGGCLGVMQADDGMLYVEYPEETVSNGKCEIAEDRGTAVVTRQMWQKERARIASEDKRLEMQNQNSAQSYESATAAREKYERELWDSMAKTATDQFITEAVRDGVVFTSDICDALTACAFKVADAFMAERAKRLRGER